MIRYCVIGYPIGHSLSPKIHNAAFRKQKVAARYEAREVAPRELRDFMKSFRGIYAGANVTIPHKEKILRFLDEVSPEAREIGAVNTIVHRDGKLIGYNTDVVGAMTALREGGVRSFKNKKALVLGAGGAARAIVYGLKKAGAQVVILNRTLVHAKKLAREFKMKYGNLSDAEKYLPCDLLINTTSVGMMDTKHSPLPELYTLLHSPKKKPLVMDIVYRPRMTKLVRDAKRAGCRVITGDRMFIAQAQSSRELFLQKL